MVCSMVGISELSSGSSLEPSVGLVPKTLTLLSAEGVSWPVRLSSRLCTCLHLSTTGQSALSFKLEFIVTGYL